MNKKERRNIKAFTEFYINIPWWRRLLGWVRCPRCLSLMTTLLPRHYWLCLKCDATVIWKGRKTIYKREGDKHDPSK